MFDVRTMANYCEFKRCTSTRFNVTELRKLLCYDKHGYFSWENVFGPPQISGCGQKKKEGTRSARFCLRTAAKCGELKRCADRVCSRTDNKDEVLEGKFINLNFLPSTKKTTEYSFELLLSIYGYLISFSQVLNFTSVELNRFAKHAELLKQPPF